MRGRGATIKYVALCYLYQIQAFPSHTLFLQGSYDPYAYTGDYDLHTGESVYFCVDGPPTSNLC